MEYSVIHGVLKGNFKCFGGGGVGVGLLFFFNTVTFFVWFVVVSLRFVSVESRGTRGMGLKMGART